MEARDSEAQGFGRGKKVRMAFGDFLRRVSGGDATLYHTTQEAAVEADGHPALYAPPLAQLAGDFPPRPALLGRLVPQAVNLWAGCAPAGASSGLHHDFHDNLYILLRGRKRFRLFPPDLAGRMHTHGRVARLHASGRLVYEGQGAVLADGSDAGDVAQWRARRGAERELAEAEEAAERGDPVGVLLLCSGAQGWGGELAALHCVSYTEARPPAPLPPAGRRAAAPGGGGSPGRCSGRSARQRPAGRFR